MEKKSFDENIYLHGIGFGNSAYYDADIQKEKLDSILKYGYLFSRRILGYKDSTGFNGMDYISLCDYTKRNEYNTGRKLYNAFNQYIVDSISLGFPKDKVDVLLTDLVNNCTLSYRGYEYMQYLGKSGDRRYSDMPDEVQVKNKLSLDKMCLLSFPSDEYISTKFFYSKKRKLEFLKEELKTIREMLDKYGYDQKIIDINYGVELNDETCDAIVHKTLTKIN